MTDRASRIVFLAELLVLALPATTVFVASLLAFFNAFLVMTDMGSLAKEPGALPWKGYLMLAAPALFALGFSAFWVLAARFVVAGRESLGRASLFLWVIVFLAQGIALAVTLSSLAATSPGTVIPALAPVMGLIFFLLPPLVHMLVVLPRDRSGGVAAAN